MFARVVTVQLKPDAADEASQFFEASVGKALKQQQGFNSARFMLDRTTNKCLMVTLWDSEANLKESETSGFLKEQLGHLGRFFAAQPAIDRYEIVGQVMT